MTVTNIQKALAAAGFDPGPIDGIRGPRTIAAIRAFQKANGLAPDGIVGEKTRPVLLAKGDRAPGNELEPEPGPEVGSTVVKPKIDENLLAAQYGFALATLNSDPELKRIFQDAVREGYPADAFIAKIRGTNWFKAHSENWRNAELLKKSDPASYAEEIAQLRTRVSMMAAEMGANFGSQIDRLATNAFSFGWDDNQIRQVLGSYVKYSDGRLLGQAGQWEREWRAWAADQGLTLSNSYYESNARRAASGSISPDDVKSAITNMAISAFPHLAERLRQGDTLATIADPYKQTMASLLELNPEGITMKDKTIRSALSSKDPKGAPVLRTLFDFENDVRGDTRWNKTKNAQDAAMETTNRVLRDMGVLG